MEIILERLTVDGYVDGSRPENDDKPYDRSDQGNLWTEDFKIHWDEVVDKPHYDPDVPDSLKIHDK